MDSIIVPEDPGHRLLTEIKQVSLAADEDASAVNALLADGWKLIHIGHTSDRTVYVLGKHVEKAQRRTGFLGATPE